MPAVPVLQECLDEKGEEDRLALRFHSAVALSKVLGKKAERARSVLEELSRTPDPHANCPWDYEAQVAGALARIAKESEPSSNGVGFPTGE